MWGFSNETNPFIKWEGAHTHTLCLLFATWCFKRISNEDWTSDSLRLPSSTRVHSHKLQQTHTKFIPWGLRHEKSETWDTGTSMHTETHTQTHKACGISRPMTSNLTFMWYETMSPRWEHILPHTHSHTQRNLEGKLVPHCQILLKRKKWL